MNMALKLYGSHIPLTNLQKILLTVGSSLTAIIDPYRHDLVADCGETTGYYALKWIRNRMQSDSEGKEIISKKPRLNSKTVDFDKLRGLPQNTFGNHYSRFYTDNNVSPDTRRIVQFVDDAELAYVMQRYREIHDITHTILNMPTTIRGEVIVKAFEGVQTRLPMCILGSVMGPLRLSSRERLKYFSNDLKWAILCGQKSKFLMNVYFEKRFEQDIDELRRELSIDLLPEKIANNDM